MSIIRLGKLIEPLDFQSYVEEAIKLPTIIHKYGGMFDIPKYPCWMEYKNEGNVAGSISFTRNTNSHPILSEMVSRVVDILTRLFPDTYTPSSDRVHFIRTVGNIVAHKDEAGRNTCINIGVKNSSHAITKISNDNIYENFEINNTTHVIEEGYGYLLNTNQLHSVESITNEPRYLITYGFGTKFDILKKLIKPKNG